MQRIMEPIFEIGYLLFAFIAGGILLRYYYKNRDVKVLLLAVMTLLLGAGDAFHLIPRMIGLLGDGLDNHVFSLGLGKLVTSVTMTVFYVLFYFFFVKLFDKKDTRTLTIAFLALAIIRIAFLTLPQNGWFEKEPSFLFAILRNIPFLLLGALFIVLSFIWARKNECFRWTYLLVFFSFLFYMGTVIFAPTIPLLGLLMLPKTVCYILIIVSALRYAKRADDAALPDNGSQN